MRLSDRVSVPRHVMAREVGDECVLLNLETGSYFGLDPVGARVWRLLGEKTSLAEVCEAILAEYEVPRDKLEEDVLHLVEELNAGGLVRLE